MYFNYTNFDINCNLRILYQFLQKCNLIRKKTLNQYNLTRAFKAI